MSEEIDAHVSLKYEIKKRLGKGAYGIVWKADERFTAKTVALKKIFDAFRNKTDAQRTFREVMLLREFQRHPNIITLTNLLRAENDKDIYLVFEFMDTDLHNVIRKGGILKEIHKQYIMYQLFCAVKYLHSGHVIHRDLKPSNVLLDVNCTMKLADFGLARSLSAMYFEAQDVTELPELTEYVATRWYRAPEILLAAKRYTKGVDMWSLGCILGEMMLGHALFPGTSTMNQIERIMRVIPSPSKLDIERTGSIYADSVLSKIPMTQSGTLTEILAKASPELAVDLVSKLLVFNPDKRLTIEQSLRHPYVAAFRNPSCEIVLTKDVTLEFPDDVQLNISDYRDKLYEMMPFNRSSQLRSFQIDLQGQQRRPPAPRSSGRDDTTPKNSVGKTRARHDTNEPMPRQKERSSAPLAQAEASDTDVDTTRSRSQMPRSSSDYKHKGYRSNSARRRSSLEMANGNPVEHRPEQPPVRNKRSWSLHKERRELKEAIANGIQSSAGAKVRFLRRYAKSKEN